MEKLEMIDGWLTELSQQNKFNIAILIAVNGKSDLINVYGYSDSKRTKPLTVSTIIVLHGQGRTIMILLCQGEGTC